MCYDEEEEKVCLPVVENLTGVLEKAGFIAQYRCRDCPPGTTTDQYHRNACRESDVIVCLIGRAHLKGKRALHIDNIIAAVNIKQKQCTNDHIIPLVYDANKSKVTELTRSTLFRKESLLLPIFEMLEYVCIKDDDWMAKILQVFTQLPAGIHK